MHSSHSRSGSLPGSGDPAGEEKRKYRSAFFKHTLRDLNRTEEVHLLWLWSVRIEGKMRGRLLWVYCKASGASMWNYDNVKPEFSVSNHITLKGRKQKRQSMLILWRLTLVVSCIFRMPSTMSDTLLCSSCRGTKDEHESPKQLLLSYCCV